MKKRCRICGEVQPLNQYPRDMGHADGRRNECRACTARDKAQRRAEGQRRLGRQPPPADRPSDVTPRVVLTIADRHAAWDAAGRPGANTGIAHCADCGIPAGQSVPLTRQGPDIDDPRRDAWQPVARPGYRCWHCEGRVLLPAEPVTA